MKKAEKFVTCPYNPEHEVLQSRLPYHIVKCQKTYTGELKKSCPFNAQHIILASSFESHLQTCPDSVGLDRNIFMSRNQTYVPQAPPPSRPTNDNDYYWDNDTTLPINQPNN